MSIMLPSKPFAYTEASKEGKIFQALKNMPSYEGYEYYVFHSVKMTQIRDNVMKSREMDFLIFHQALGLLCVECKAGKVTFANGDWYYSPKAAEAGKKPMLHGGPFRQAETNIHLMESYIRNKCISLSNARKELFLNHCKLLHSVCFPGRKKSDEEFKNSLPPGEQLDRLIIFAEDLERPEKLEEKIRDIFSLKVQVNSENRIVDDNTDKKTIYISTGYPDGSPLTDADRKALFDSVLCPHYHIVETRNDNNEIAYISLNEDQLNLLALMETKNEMAVSGWAGTGKTILALELAWSKALQGEKVLFLCSNKFVREDLQTRNKKKRIKFTDIEWICDNWLKELKPEERSDLQAVYADLRSKIESSKIVNEDEPENSKKNYEYTTVIVDEGQDFWPNNKDNTYYNVLCSLYCIMQDIAVSELDNKMPETLRSKFERRLKRNSNAFRKSFYIFYDEFQSEKRAREDSGVPVFIKIMKNQFELGKNCRNTINIGRTALRPLTETTFNYCQRAEEGNKPKMYFYESKKDFYTQLTGLLQNLDPANTVLLTCKNDWLLETDEQEKSIFTTFEERVLKILFKSKNGKKIFDKDSINYFIVKKEKPTDIDKTFLFTSWKKFKGLERSNVVILDFEPGKFFEQKNEEYAKRFYVVMTRAQDSAYILVSDPYYEKDTDEREDFVFDVLKDEYFIDKRLEKAYDYLDYEGYLIELEKIIENDSEFKENLKRAGNEDCNYEKLSMQCEIPADILKKYVKVLNGGWKEEIEEEEREKTEYHKLRKNLNESYDKIYRSFRDVNKRMAICAALNAESMCDYDVVMQKTFKELLEIGRKAESPDVSVSEDRFHTHIKAMISIWDAMSGIFDSMENLNGSDCFDLNYVEIDMSEIPVYNALIESPSKGIDVESLWEDWRKGVERMGTGFWENFFQLILFVDFPDKLDYSNIEPENMEKLKKLEQEAMGCCLKALEKLDGLAGAHNSPWKDFTKNYFKSIVFFRDCQQTKDL